MTLRFPLIISLIPVFIASVPLIVGIILLSRKSKIGYVGIVIGAFIGAIAGPVLFADKITLTGTHIEHRTGIWFIPRVYGITYADTEKIIIEEEENREGRLEEIWYFVDNNGNSERVNPGDLWVFRREPIIDSCREQGIEVLDNVRSY